MGGSRRVTRVTQPRDSTRLRPRRAFPSPSDPSPNDRSWSPHHKAEAAPTVSALEARTTGRPVSLPYTSTRTRRLPWVATTSVCSDEQQRCRTWTAGVRSPPGAAPPAPRRSAPGVRFADTARIPRRGPRPGSARSWRRLSPPQMVRPELGRLRGGWPLDRLGNEALDDVVAVVVQVDAIVSELADARRCPASPRRSSDECATSRDSTVPRTVTAGP